MNIAPYVCLVSEQPMPNLTPALDPQFGSPHIVLLESQHMRQRADWLENVLRRHKREVSRRTIDDSGDLGAFRDQIGDILAEFPGAILNATGGLKTMSILAFDAFRAAGRPVFYVERDNRVIWLNPVDRPGQRLVGALKLEDYFSAFGQSLASLQRQPDKSDGGEGMLNRLSSLPASGHGDHHRIGTQFESLVFRAFGQAVRQALDCPTYDLAWGVKVAGSSADEFDVVLVRDNTLFLVECKHSNGANLNAFLNKLDNLRRKRGITARAALVTTASVPPEGGHARRARDSGIMLLAKNDLPQLRQLLALWVGT